MISCPETQLLSETDFPYMAPEPLRGGECTPAMVVHTVERLGGDCHVTVLLGMT